MTNIPDYSNIQFSMADMERFFKDGNIQLDAKSKEKLNTIFEKCDKRNTDGKKLKGGDGQLTGKERESFMKKIKKKMPELYSQVVDFFVTVDVIEDMKQQQETALKELEKQEKEFTKEQTEREIKYFNGSK